MYSRIIKAPRNKSFFLFGPRGTGKTTWVKEAYPGALYLDLLEAGLYNDLLAYPQRLENLIPPGFEGWIIIDEVQKIPELLDEVHRLIEKHKYKFILTGSSARKIKQKGPKVNLLAGRALSLSMDPLTVSELGPDFNLNHSLRYGHLPSACTEADPEAYLESYVKTYLKEEVLQEGLTRSLGPFSRFLEAASFSQGSPLNISSVARECSVQRKAAENYFTILEDLLIGYRVPVFTRRAERRLTHHPKFYFFDVGVYRTIRPMGPLDQPHEAEGIAFETLLFQELNAVNSALSLGYSLFYWRTSNQAEVDFVLYGTRGFFAFEVKRTGKVTDRMLSGLKSFLKEYPQAKGYFVYGGTRRFYQDSVEIIPMDEILRALPGILTS
ncbi:MAG: AAA family ATPase [Candidatus Eremiobacteraeota bacterium]|nr:AAA family ATPase [Candidatus Eremiobacteraeota bacterium]